MKECFKCKRVLPLDDFYRHAKMADGHLGKCKECTRADVRSHRAANDSVREYDRKRYYESRSRREKTAATSRRWNERNPDGYRAHYAVTNAVRDGRLQKQPCEICGETKVHAHHDDYAKPLEVRWLCVRHHAAVHAADKTF